MLEERSQGAFEYVLLLAGILLVVVMAIVILRSSVVPQAENTVNTNIGIYQNATTIACDAAGNCN